MRLFASDLESINSSKQRGEHTLYRFQVGTGGETIRSSAFSFLLFFFSFFISNTFFSTTYKSCPTVTTVFHLKQLHRGIAETIVSRESLGKSRDSLCVRHTRLKALGESNGGLINRIESIETNKWHGRVAVNGNAARNIIHFPFSANRESWDFVYYTPPRFSLLCIRYVHLILQSTWHPNRWPTFSIILYISSTQRITEHFYNVKNVADMLLRINDYYVINDSNESNTWTKMKYHRIK